MIFQILDVDYSLNNGKPIVRLYGKSSNGNPVCFFYDKFFPYFYIRTDKNVEELSQKIEAANIEEVEMRLPVGYRTEKTKLIKITIFNPQEVPVLRERLIKEKIAQEVFEADILFKYRFMVDYALRGMQWVEIEGEKTFTKLIKMPTYLIRKIRPVQREETSNLKYLVFDIECLPQDLQKGINSKNDPIIMISVCFSPENVGKKSVVLVSKPARGEGVEGFINEKEMLLGFLKIIERYDPDIISGYNVNAFDFPYLLDRLKFHNIPPFFGRCIDKPVYITTYGMTQECIIPGRIVADPYQILKRDPWVKYHRYDLNTIAKTLLKEEKLDVSYGDMPSLWNGNSEALQKLIDYARKDSELALRLLLERGMLDKFIELSKISGLLLKDCFGGQASRIENMLLHEFKNRGFVMPAKPTQYDLARRIKERKKNELKGAAVLEPKKGLHAEGCTLVLDFRSLYPNLIRTFNISPDTITTDSESYLAPTGSRFIRREVYSGIFPEILSTLIEARGKVKGLMRSANSEERRILNAKQLALKDMSNSFYGYIGYVRARLYVLEMASAITAYGRENLEKTKKLVEGKFDVDVVYGDTDSIFLKTKITDLEKAKELGEEIAAYVSGHLEGSLELESEKIYKTFLILTKKRYAGWKFSFSPDGWKDVMEMKGIETVRRDWCPLVSETMKEILDIILKEGDVPKAVSTLKAVQEKLKRNEIPLEKLTIIKGITKSIDNYEGMLPHIELARKIAERNPAERPKIGDRLGFVITKGRDLLSKRAEDPEFIRKNNIAVDADYYIYSQLFPPIERIFDSLGITKSDIFDVGRQKTIFDIVKEMSLEDWETFVCKNCGKNSKSMPLKGFCDCGGEMLFSKGNVISSVIRKT